MFFVFIIIFFAAAEYDYYDSVFNSSKIAQILSTGKKKRMNIPMCKTISTTVN